MGFEHCSSGLNAAHVSRWSFKGKMLFVQPGKHILGVIPTLTHYSDIVCDIPSGSVYLAYLCVSQILSDALSGIYSDILSDNLSGLLPGMSSSPWRPPLHPALAISSSGSCVLHSIRSWRRQRQGGDEDKEEE